MRDIVLVAPEGFGLHSITSALPTGMDVSVDESEERVLVQVDETGGVVEFVRDESLAVHYDDPEELSLLAVAGPSPQFFLVHFKSIEPLRSVLMAIADRCDVLVDNDFGIIESGDKFVGRWKQSPSWDWVPK